MSNFLRDSQLTELPSLDRDMMDELYRQMVRVVRHKLHCKSDVGDVVQEAWVRILEKRSTLREADKLVPWAKTIASNLASNANRARRPIFSLDDLPQGYHSVSSRSSNPELRSELSDLLGRLDPITRTLLLYKFYYGFRDDEIAAALEVPIGTIKSRIHREKLRLKAQELRDSSTK